MGIDIEYIDGQTPIDEEEKEGIIMKTITTRSDLDEFEQQNIEQAIEWTMTRKFKKEIIFSEEFVCGLHNRMFGNVWKWAGQFRKTEKSIGIDPIKISVSLKQLNDDCLYWVENNIYSNEEIAIRYKHSLVKIHCFANGNGRHSRLMADLIMNKIYLERVFDWGRSNLGDKNEARDCYLKALREADKGNIHPLINFAKSQPVK